MKEPPSSGTAERLLTYGGLGTAAGALYNFDPEDFQRNAALAGLTLGLGRGASSILRSNALANSMIRHGLGISLGNPLANFTRRAAPAAA